MAENKWVTGVTAANPAHLAMIFSCRNRRNRESFSDGGAGLGVVRVEDGAKKIAARWLWA